MHRYSIKIWKDYAVEMNVVNYCPELKGNFKVLNYNYVE